MIITGILPQNAVPIAIAPKYSSVVRNKCQMAKVLEITAYGRAAFKIDIAMFPPKHRFFIIAPRYVGAFSPASPENLTER